MSGKIFWFAAVVFILPFFSSNAQGNSSELEEPRIHRHVWPPGFEEAKKRANEGLAEPSAKELVSLPPIIDEPAGPIFGGSFLGQTQCPGCFPPDLTMAAGRNHVVAATNFAVQIFDKTGTLLSTPGGSLCGFFNQGGGTPLCNLSDTNPAGDPRAIYDEYIDRFWVIAMSVNDNPNVSPRTSNLRIALSNSGDPTMGWAFFSTNAMLTFNQLGLRDSGLWCDFPTVGIDAQALYVSCNMNSFTVGPLHSKLRIMTKSQFIAGDPILWWDFFDGDLCEGILCAFRSFTIQPAHMRGAQLADGEFLINSVPIGGFTLAVRHVTSPQSCCVPGAQSAPTLVAVGHTVGHYGIPRDARQRGTRVRIDTSLTHLHFAVWQGGLLSTGQNLACAFLSGSCVSFTELDVSAYPTIATVNDWMLDPPGGVDNYYPALDVNAAGRKTMVFTRSGENEFASAAFIGIPPRTECTTCTDGSQRFLAAGTSTYVQLEGPPLNRNRWGDYSGASADPDGVGIWIFGQFVPSTDRWGAQIGLTQRSILNPIPHISSLSRSTVYVGTPGLSLTISGADFLPSSQVQLNGSPRETTFVSSRVLRANVLPADLQTEQVVQITVFNPAPGGGTSDPVGLFVCAGSISWVGPANGLWQTPSNWDSGILPGPGSDVCIGPGVYVTLSLFGNYSISSLRSHGGLEISHFATLSIANPSFISNALTIGDPAGDGTLTGTGDLVLSGVLVWRGGLLSGSGTLTANGGVDLDPGNSTPRLDKTLVNNGSALWHGGSLSGNLLLLDGAVFDNRGSFDVRVTSVAFDHRVEGVGRAVFNNPGTFLKSEGNGAIRFVSLPFNNTGNVAVKADTLSFEGGGSSSGNYTVDSESTLGFAGNHALNGTIEGAGTVSFLNTGVMNIGGVYNITGTTRVSQGATVNFNPGMSLISLGELSLTGGTVNLSSGTPLVRDTFTLSVPTSILTGSDSITVNGLFTWREGTLSGSGPFYANGGIALPTGSGTKVLMGRTLTNVATATWTDTSGNGIGVVSGAVFDNQGVFDVQVDGTISGGGTPLGVFNNSGVFQKSAGTGTTNVWVPFNNFGALSAQIGTLSFTEPYRQLAPAATTTLEGGAFTSTSVNIQQGSLAGFGTLTGNVANGGTASPGTALTATLNIVGNYNHDATANLSIRIGGRAAGEFAVLAVTGSAALAGGTLTVSLLSPFTPALGDSFEIMTFASRSGTFATTTLPPLPVGLAWDLQYGASALTLNVIEGAGARAGATSQAQ